jgi:hypothetical protein
MRYEAAIKYIFLYYIILFSVANDSQLFFFLMDTCSFLDLVW